MNSKVKREKEIKDNGQVDVTSAPSVISVSMSINSIYRMGLIESGKRE